MARARTEVHANGRFPLSRIAGVVIRPASTDEIDALVDLASTTFRDTYGATDAASEIADYIAANFTRQAFADILADASMTLLVAESAERLLAGQGLAAAALRHRSSPARTVAALSARGHHRHGARSGFHARAA